jgi:hypothetical protein
MMSKGAAPRPISIGCGDYAQGSFDLLPLAGERARGALFFAGYLRTAAVDHDNLDVARRYLRAALSEFRSVFDLLGADFKVLGMATLWSRSPQYAEMEADPLVTLLRKVRDFAIHSSVVTGVPRTFKVGLINERTHRVVDMNSIVIDPLVRGGRVNHMRAISDTALADFNDIAHKMPADMVLQVAVYRTSEYLAEFLAKHPRDHRGAAGEGVIVRPPSA